MADPISIADVLKLSVSERIQLVGDIWDSIAAVPEAVPLTDAQRAELDRRLDSYHRDPAAGSPWDAARQRIRGDGCPRLTPDDVSAALARDGRLPEAGIAQT